MYGSSIVFPVITDPWPLSTHPVAPRAPAAGAYQVLLDRGAFFLNELDLSVGAVAFPIEWKRHYLSDVKAAEGGVKDGGLIGQNWDFAYNKRIVPMGNAIGDGLQTQTVGQPSQITYYDGQGRGELYNEKHSEIREVQNFDTKFKAYVTTYLSPPGQFHEIERYVLLDPHSQHPFKEHPNVEPQEQIFYVLREKNGTRLAFNCRGQMIYILSRHSTKAHPVRVELDYQGPLNPLTQNKMLSTILDAKKRIFSVSTVNIGEGPIYTNIDCTLVSKMLPIPRIKSFSGLGLSVTYNYQNGDTTPVLESVAQAGGSITRNFRYEYDGQYQMLNAKDPNGLGGLGAYIVNTYAGGKISTQTLGESKYTISYGSPITVTGLDGSVREYTLEGIERYQVIHQLTVKGSDPKQGGPWTTVYDHNGETQVTKITYPKGNGVSYEYATANAPITAGPMLDWPERGWVYESDLAVGNLLKTTTFAKDASAGTVEASTTYEHLYNQVDTATDVRGGVSTNRYDYAKPGDRGEPLTSTLPDVAQPGGNAVKRNPAEFTYDDDGQRITADFGGGRLTKYEFQPTDGYLFRITYPTLAYVKYDLTPRGEILHVSGSMGEIDYKRDGMGRITDETHDPSGAKALTHYEYDATGNLRLTRATIRDCFDSGEASRAGIAAGADRTRQTVTRYNVSNEKIDETTTGDGLTAVTSYTYDDGGRVKTKTTPALGTGGGSFVARYEYDANGQLIRLTEADGAPEAMVTTYTRDLNGNETLVARSGGKAKSSYSKTYDGFDRIDTETSALNAVTTYHYEPGGKIAEMEVKGSPGPGKAPALLYHSRYAWDDYDHMIERDLDTLVSGEATTRWFYDGNLELSRIQAPNNTDTTFQHDLDGHVTHVTDPVGNETITDYNSKGQAWKITQKATEKVYNASTGAFDDKPTEYVTYQRFDGLGNMIDTSGGIQSVSSFYDTAGELRGSFVAGEGLTLYTYDGLGRRHTTTRDDFTETTEYTPGGVVSETTTPAAHTKYELDSFGRATLTTDALAGASTKVVYDGLGAPIVRIDPNGTAVSTTFDAEGNPLTATAALADVTVTVSGPPGQGPQVVRAIGGVTSESYDYDALGRVVRSRNDSPSDIQLSYDGLGRVVTETQIFRSYGQTINRRFDASDSYREIDYPEIAGRQTVHYDFDELGRVTQVQAGGQTIAAYLYTGADRIARETLANGVQTRYGYDAVRRLNSIGVGRVAPGGGPAGDYWTVNSQYSGSTITHETETQVATAGGVAPRVLDTSLAYDSHSRLTSATTETYTSPKTPGDPTDQTATTLSEYSAGGLAATTDFVRDAAGKIQNVKADALSWSGGRVSSVQTVGASAADTTAPLDTVSEGQNVAAGASGAQTRDATLYYDKDGNLIYDGRFVYAWDFHARLTKIEDTWYPFRYTEGVIFSYDNFNRRIFAQPYRDRVPTGVFANANPWNKWPQWFLYDGERVIAEAWVGNVQAPKPITLLARYYFGADTGRRLRMDRTAEDNPGGRLSTYYLHQGPTGDIKLLTDSGGYPTLAANVNPAPGSGAAAPGAPPEDRIEIFNTGIRLPYSSATNRTDTFAALLFNEAAGRPLLNERIDHAWSREVDTYALKQSTSALQTRLFALSIGLAALPATAGASAAYLGGSAFAVGTILGGSVNLALNAGTAWYTQSGYSVEEGIGNFATGAIGGMTGAVATEAASGVVSELMLNYAANLSTDTYFGAVIDGQSWRDSFANSLVSAAQSAAIGVGTAKLKIGLEWAATKATASFNAQPGFVREGLFNPEGEIQSRIVDKSEYYLDKTTREQRNIDQYRQSTRIPNQEKLRVFEFRVIRELLNGTAVSRELARRLLVGDLELRVSQFSERGVGGAWHPCQPNVLKINSRYMRNPRLFASIIVHEGTHALGGTELTAHLAQAQFLVEREVITGRNHSETYNSAEKPGVDHYQKLIDAWSESTMGPMYEFILNKYSTEVVGGARGVTPDPWIQTEFQGSWSRALGMSDPRVDYVEARSQRFAGLTKSLTKVRLGLH